MTRVLYILGTTNQGPFPSGTRKSWWNASTDASGAFWAALDIELAYPSVRIKHLARATEQALLHPVDISELFDDCPEPVLEALSIQDVRVEIGRRLMRALGNVAIDPGEISSDSWGPPIDHPLPQVTANPYDGIPTGLAISGMLLNVALLEADQEIGTYLEQTSGKMRGAIVRFVDDMYVMSRSSTGLLSLIETVHSALSGVGQVSLATPNETSNICINFRKIKPDAAKNVIGKYLLENGWTECKKCKQPLPPFPQVLQTSRISRWWEVIEKKDEFPSVRKAFERSAIEEGNVSPFVTTLVERLSDMGTDTLRHRFGEGARDHLARLHELARFEIEDEQVRPDTRRTFSVNRLVRAWLPRSLKEGEESRELRQIRDTISFVLDCTPWKFVIWRAVVRGAARRPLNESENEESTTLESSKWLSNQLRRIACEEDPKKAKAWLNQWPEINADDKHAEDRKKGWREFYLSFLRTAFWHSLAQVVRELRWHSARMKQEEDDSWVPSPYLWTVRAVAEDSHDQVADNLAHIDNWVDVLYPASSSPDLEAWPWELDGFVGAILAAHTTVELAHAWRRVGGPKTNLLVPTTKRLQKMPKAYQLLSKFGRQVPLGPRRSRKLDYWTLANVRMACWDNALGRVLFPPNGRPRIRQTASNPRGVLAAGFSLHCDYWIGLPFAKLAFPPLDECPKAFQANPFLMQDYARARKIIVSQEAISVTVPTVHRLLWGKPEKSNLKDWQMAASETPALGLPSRIAVGLFRAVHEKKLPTDWVPHHGPLTWLIHDVKSVLASGRHSQFYPRINPDPSKQKFSSERSSEWEVMPHPAFYLPFVSATACGVHPRSYVLYCDMLLLLTALDGSEQILDGLLKWGVKGTPFKDRWAWRSRIHLPLEAWNLIEKVLRWNVAPTLDVTQSIDPLLDSLANWSSESVSWEDFQPERIDIGLSPKGDLDIVRTIRPAGKLIGPDLPSELRIEDASITENLGVRVGQIAAWPEYADVREKFPAISSAKSNEMIQQVTNVFQAPAPTDGDSDPRLVVLPELAIPQQEIRSLRELVGTEGKAAVAGLYWRKLKPAFRPPINSTPGRLFFVNEAELIFPIVDDKGPPAVRWFRVRKILPAHEEEGLAKALSKPGSAKWHILPGRKWYRFVHPGWGDFTVAICSDLIDATPWRTLRGELLHLLMVAFNKDVELFDSLTWVRAYENYVNVVSVNHGKYGGSFLWTPQRRHRRELARLRGNGLVLTADILLPVKNLLQEQENGVKNAICKSASEWQGERFKSKEFKAPPPGFLRKNY